MSLVLDTYAWIEYFEGSPSGLKVKDVLVVVDREQGGKEFLEEKGFILHSAIKITELIILSFGVATATLQTLLLNC